MWHATFTENGCFSDPIKSSLPPTAKARVTRGYKDAEQVVYQSEIYASLLYPSESIREQRWRIRLHEDLALALSNLARHVKSGGSENPICCSVRQGRA